MRPANIVTAFADILAGAAAVGSFTFYDTYYLGTAVSAEEVGWLLLSTFGLYGGGVVFNDFFDADLDAQERPERPIPSGRASKEGAAIWGILLLLTGIVSALQVSWVSGGIAVGVSLLVLIYDKWAKHSTIGGPILMGSCRGGNLLLGASIAPAALTEIWFLFWIPLLYIGAITLISQGEVHGGNRPTGYISTGLVALVILLLSLLSVRVGYHFGSALPFLILFGMMTLPAFIKAARTPNAPEIRKAVKRGVLSLIIVNSIIVAGFAGFVWGMLILLLLPFSLLLSRLFSVT